MANRLFTAQMLNRIQRNIEQAAATQDGAVGQTTPSEPSPTANEKSQTLNQNLIRSLIHKEQELTGVKTQKNAHTLAQIAGRKRNQ